MQECQRLGIANVEIDDIYLGNGVSELITIAMQALLNDGDQVLILSDYPLDCSSQSERAHRFTTCVTNSLTGIRVWRILRQKLLQTPKHL